jgi:hypothetical protein
VTGNPPTTGGAGRRISERPVGLKVLAFFGYPVQRAFWGRRKASVFVFPVLSVMVLCGMIYLVGLVLALHYGVGGAFVGNPLIPSILFATAWGDVWIAWAASVYESWGIGGEENLFEAQTVPFVHLSEPQRDRLRTHWRRLCDLRLASLYAIPVIVLVIAYVYVSIYPPFGLPSFVPASVLAIYAGPMQTHWMFVYLAAVAAIFANTGAFGLFFTFEHLRFVTEFIEDEKAVVRTNRSVSVKHLYLSRRPLEELSFASFLSSIAWFGAVGVLAAVFVVELNWLTLLALFALIAVGLYVFVRPQWEVHLLIRTAKATAVGQLESSLPADWYDPGKGVPKAEHLPVLGMLHDVASTSEWHIDVRLVFAQVLAALFPILAAYLGGPLGLRLQ